MRWIGTGGSAGDEVTAMAAVPFAPVLERERQRAFDTLVLAFTADPVIRWLYPDAGSYLRRFPEFLAAFGGRAF